MTDSPHDPDDEEDSSTQFLESVSRRGALGSGALAVSTALVGCLSIDQFFGQGEDSQPDQDTRMWDTETRVRQTKQGDVDGSFSPSFEYDPVDVQVEAAQEEPITRIVAAPAESNSGDRAAMECRSSETDAVATLLVLFWAQPEQEGTIEVQLNDQSINFQIFTGEYLALAIATRSLNADADRSEILLTRAPDISTVESLASDFSRLYG